MSGEDVDATSTVSGRRTAIPEPIRRELDIDDGDKLRWVVEDDSLSVEVVRQRDGTFAEFDGYDGTEPSDAVSNHDAWGREDT